jgi:hypothetical protein
MEGSCFSLSALERRIGAIFFYWDVYNMFLQVRHFHSNMVCWLQTTAHPAFFSCAAAFAINNALHKKGACI